MIALSCPSCGKNLRIADEHAGKTGKCPQCRTSILIPGEPVPLVAVQAVAPASSHRAATAPRPATPPAAPVKPVKPTKRETDNIGTRQDTLRKAEMYWMARQMKSDKEPYLLYYFPNEQAARDALLALPCIYVASDSGQLVCTGPLTFGYYRAEAGDYEAIVAGWALTVDLFEKGRERFRQHGGKPRGTGELAPTHNGPPAPSAAKAAGGSTPPGSSGVRFVKRYEKPTALGTMCTYEIYSGDGEQSAIAFLKSKPVTQPMFYRIVETPEGNWGCDKDGMYKE